MKASNRTDASVQAILNRAKSTLNQSRQFRDNSSSVKFSVNPQEQEEDRNNRPQTAKSSLFQLQPNNKKSPIVDNNEAFVPPTISAANYDYDSIFNSNSNKKASGRSDFNIFLMSPNNSSISEPKESTIVMKPVSNVRFQSQIQKHKESEEPEEEYDDDSESKSLASSAGSNHSSTGDDEKETITPPTITETFSRSQKLASESERENEPLKRTNQFFEVEESLQRSYTEDFTSDFQSVSENLTKSVAFADPKTISESIPEQVQVLSDSVEVPEFQSDKSSMNSSRLKNKILEKVSNSPEKNEDLESLDDITSEVGMYYVKEGRIQRKSGGGGGTSSSGSKSVPDKPQPKIRINHIPKKIPNKSPAKVIKPTKIDYSLARQSSRKLFQEVLSKLDLLEEAEAAEDNSKFLIHPETEKKSKKYVPPKTKQQTQIHAILEKEVYQKELQRLRKLHLLEEKREQREKVQRAKNFKIMNDMQNARALRLPEVDVEEEESFLWGPGNPDDDNYLNQVRNMNGPELVREVVKSNERMYKMTVKAAKEMTKMYNGRKKR